MNIMTVDKIAETYGFTKTETYALLKVPGCPVLPRTQKRGKYRVIQDEFENWLRRQSVK